MYDADDLEVGMYCDAIYYGDGLWYTSIIEMISQHGLHVKYKQFEESEVVSFDSIRITPEQKIQNDKRKEFLKKKREPEDELEFKIPDNLKISPADSETQRLTKKKKLKALKNLHKQKIIEKNSKEKQDKWLSFCQKNSKEKIGSNLSGSGLGSSFGVMRKLDDSTKVDNQNKNIQSVYKKMQTPKNYYNLMKDSNLKK